MPNKNYQRGRAFEYRVKNELEKFGFIVLRTSGSHGFSDLVALKDNVVYFMQLKYGAKITTKEKDKMYYIMQDYAWNNSIKFFVVHGVPYKGKTFYELTPNNTLRAQEIR